MRQGRWTWGVAARAVAWCLALSGYSVSNAASPAGDADATSPTVLPAYRFDPGRPAEALADPQGLFVRALVFQDDVLLPPAVRRDLEARFTGRSLSAGDLVALRDEVTAYYVDRGYVTSGAVIESLQDQVLTVRSVPGRLAGIEVDSDGRFREAFLERYLAALGSDESVNVFELEQRLQVLQQDPRIAAVEAQLLPGSRPGESVLKVRPRESSPWIVRLETSNYRPPAIGEWNVGASVDALNLFGWGDTARVGIWHSEGLTEIDAGYAVPINARGTRLELFASGTDSEVVTAPFDDLDIEATTRSYGMRIFHPVRRTPAGHSLLSLGLEWRESETFLLGSGFSFVEGPDDGLAQIAVVRGGWEWLARGPAHVLAARAELSVGVDAFGATTASGDVADGQFQKLLVQLQWARRLPWRNSQLVLRLDGQATDDPLLGMEQIALGGRWTVRGYRENTVIRDNAVVGSVEWRVPLWRDVRGASLLEIRPFVDAAWSANEAREEIGPRTLWSPGIGLFWQQPALGLQAELYWGEAMNEVDYPGEYSIQDDGLHFRFAWSGP